MFHNQWITVLGLFFSGVSIAAPISVHHEQVQVPQCLAAKIVAEHVVLAENKQFKIIDLSSSELNALSLLADETNCGRYKTITHRFKDHSFVGKKQTAKLLLEAKPKVSKVKFGKDDYSIRHQMEVNAALAEVVDNNIWQTLTHLTSYRNRYASSKTGVEAANWLKSQFENMAAQYNRTDTTTFFVETGWYKQPSLVTVIGKDLNGPGIVLGAHMDTLDGRMPGAGDDGSGSSSLMEAARVLLASKATLKRPIYIIWYSAEELGLIGSQYVVDYFQEKRIPVKAAVQFDMTGYRVHAKDPTMWVYTDYTDKGLSGFVTKLISTYLHVPVDYSRCGYGCSDHASWTDAGIPSAFPCESNFDEHNPYIHSSSDTMDLLSLEHMTNFSKLAVAFAIELAME